MFFLAVYLISALDRDAEVVTVLGESVADIVANLGLTFNMAGVVEKAFILPLIDIQASRAAWRSRGFGEIATVACVFASIFSEILKPFLLGEITLLVF